YLTVVEVLVVAVGRVVGVRLGLLLGDPLVERLAGRLLVRRVAEALPGRPPVGRRGASVQLVLDLVLGGVERVLNGQLVLEVVVAHADHGSPVRTARVVRSRRARS